MTDNEKKIREAVLTFITFLPITTIIMWVLIAEGNIRHLLFAYIALVSINLPYRIVSIHNDLCKKAREFKKNSPRFRHKIKNIKFAAEICAGIAIAGVMFTVYKNGIEFDQFNVDSRFTHARQAYSKFTKLAGNDCKKQITYPRKNGCLAIQENFNSIMTSLINDSISEATLKNQAQTIDSYLNYFAMPKEEKKVAEIRNLIEKITIDVNHVDKLLSISLYLSLLLFSTAAVAGKVAIAWYEVREEKINMNAETAEEKELPPEPLNLGNKTRYYFHLALKKIRIYS